MADIYLIRHGQASFGKTNYDQLSALGIKQAQCLGEHCQGWMQPAVLFEGSLQRHVQTRSAFNNGYNLAAKQATKTELRAGVVEHAGLNEFDHENILGVAFPEYQDKNLLATYLGTQENPRKAFHLLYQASIERWLKSENPTEYAESWPVFKQRVLDAFSLVRDVAHAQGSVAVFTSGGPIGVILQHILQVSDEVTFALNEQLVNSCISHVLSSKSRLSAGYFNNYQHLHDLQGAITYR
jgi:broad specificity phosphatase PhoE